MKIPIKDYNDHSDEHCYRHEFTIKNKNDYKWHKEMIDLEEQWSREAIALAYKIGIGVGVLITLIVVDLIKLIMILI